MFFFPAAIHSRRICLCRAISPSTCKSCSGGSTGRAGVGVRWFGNTSVPARRSVCPRFGPCRSVAFPSKALLVRVRRSLYRMHLRSVRDNSWSIHDYRALAPIGEDTVFDPRGRGLSVTMIAGGGARTHTILRSLDFESSASANSATPAKRIVKLRCQRRSSRASNEIERLQTSRWSKNFAKNDRVAQSCC